MAYSTSCNHGRKTTAEGMFLKFKLVAVKEEEDFSHPLNLAG
jgi:hypothetical protein